VTGPNCALGSTVQWNGTGLMNMGEPVPSRDGKKLFVQGWQQA
jgi:hypothetical protein